MRRASRGRSRRWPRSSPAPWRAGSGISDHDIRRRALSDRDLARRNGRPGAPHRDRRAGLGRGGAQQPLGRLAAGATMPASASHSLDDLHEVVAFFEERRGRLHGFRWKDHADFKSCAPRSDHAARPGRSARATARAPRFSWSRRYGSGAARLCAGDHQAGGGSVRVAVGGVEADFALDAPDRHRHLRSRTRGRRGGDRRLRVRRAGALRHRRAAHQPRGLRGPARFRRFPSWRSGMRALPAGLQAHLDSGATTLCRCWRLITAAAARCWASPITTAPWPSTAPTFEAESGFTATEIESALGFRSTTSRRPARCPPTASPRPPAGGRCDNARSRSGG